MVFAASGVSSTVLTVENNTNPRVFVLTARRRQTLSVGSQGPRGERECRVVSETPSYLLRLVRDRLISEENLGRAAVAFVLYSRLAIA